MKKQYSIPTFAVVRINRTNVIATSTVSNCVNDVGFIYGGGWNGYARSAGRGFDDYDSYSVY